MPNDYLANALWSAAIDASNHKDLDGLQDVVSALKSYLPQKVKVTKTDESSEFEVKDTYVDTVLSFLEHYQCWEKFVSSNPVVYEDFTIEDYRAWLSKNYKSELKTLECHVPNWVHSITHVFGQRYVVENNEYFKNIERLRKGHYKVKSRLVSPILRLA